MKNLGQFFDVNRFMDGKKLVVTDNQPCVDYDTKLTIGRTLEVGIMVDNTYYVPSKSGYVTNNLLEKFRVKVLDDGKGNADKIASIPSGTYVQFPKFTKATLWVNTNGKNPVMDMSLETYDVVVVKDEKK